jgi:cytochrome bd ubiquinol oxidase subunit II
MTCREFLTKKVGEPRPAGHGIAVWNASSSAKTLGIMLIAVIVFLPVVLLYKAWVFRVLKGRITLEEIRRHTGLY